MQQFRADLHIHSRFSRATSKKLTPRNLAAWGKVKGLDVLGTGDCTHPEWLDELEDQLVLDEASGLYCLKDENGLEKEIPQLEGPLGGRTRFMLQGEISSIYKRAGKTRKVHNLVYMPTLEAARSFSQKLGEVGNITSDGRPILGLDSRNLLEMVLETHPQAFLVPAHIWTPWFSVFGSKSGFDAIEECFGDLASEIFALETGLSSDPEMNWLLSALDRFKLISNSDAHSGDKLGRECNLFSGEISYEGIYRSLRGEALGHKFLGTLEFFPEEGKYHLDGHRKCGVMMEPREAIARDNKCPVCGKPLTVGVLHRVLELADRQVPEQPAGQPGFMSLVPLAELLSEVVGTGPKSKKVMTQYARAIARFGSEVAILRDVPEEDLRLFNPLLAEGIGRMRRGEVMRSPGFDGEYGVVRVFSEKERREFTRGATLVDIDFATPAATHSAAMDQSPASEPAGMTEEERASRTPQFDLALAKRNSGEERTVVFNSGQQHAIDAGPGAALVLAGPGTGKTRTLVGRVARLIEQGENPRHILALTFTRRAAREMEERLVASLGKAQGLPRADTLHALAFEYWQSSYDNAPTLLSEEGARRVFAEANPSSGAQELREAWEAVNLCRERMQSCSIAFQPLYAAYEQLKDSWNLADYTDLLEFWLEQLGNGVYIRPWTQILVDEVQDLSPLQLTLVRHLVPAGGQGFFGIGDPDQSIYGFRGAHGDVMHFLQEAWPDLQVVKLTENYRSAQRLLDFSAALMQGHTVSGALTARGHSEADITLFEAPTSEGEAAWICDRIHELLGATSHTLADARAGDGRLHGELAPGDIAILVRFKALIPVLKRTLNRMGIPCAVPEEEAFWVEPRVQKILDAAGRFLGIAGAPDDDALNCPESVLAKGPSGIAAFLEDIPPFDRLFWQSSAFRQLVAAYKEHDGWSGLLNWIHLQSELELVRRKSEKVQIMTLHAAKGLEFPAVFLPGLEDGILPFAGGSVLAGKLDKPDSGAEEGMDIAEERRLLFVGLTRAESALYLSRAAKRMLYGKEVRLKASRFITALPLDDVKRSTLKAHTKHKEQQLSLM